MKRILGQLAGASVVGVRHGLGFAARRVVPLPHVDSVPQGRIVDLPGRGRTFVVDVPGPTPDAPTIVLLHALGCTAYLSWVAALGELSRRYRVVMFDQRWHGRGIRSSRFRFADCADDVVAVLDELGIDSAVVAGYSMGGAVAQLTWQRHPERVDGLVLCSIARNLRGARREKLFFPLLTAAMHPVSGYALTRVERLAQTLPEVPSVDPVDPTAWGAVEFRSTSAWSFPEVLGERGRFNSAPWIGTVDVPTSVVVTAKDHTIPERRQRRLAACIDGAEVFTAPGGHSSLFLDAANWVPVFLEAVDAVAARLDAAEEIAG
ncbi:MAG: alpha/beta fold hydrolase [Nocardioides sp.]